MPISASTALSSGPIPAQPRQIASAPSSSISVSARAYRRAACPMSLVISSLVFGLTTRIRISTPFQQERENCLVERLGPVGARLVARALDHRQDRMRERRREPIRVDARDL